MNPLTAFREFAVRLPATLSAAAQAAVKREVAQILVTDVRRRFVTGTDPGGRRWPKLSRRRPTGGDKPLLDTGLLRASVASRVTVAGVEVFSNLPQARLHEFGGTVRPKRAKYLSIPLTREAKRAGSPRRFKGKLKFRPLRKGTVRGVLYTQPKKGAVVSQFLLVTQAVIPARPFLAPSAAALALVDEVVTAAVAAAAPKE